MMNRRNVRIFEFVAIHLLDHGVCPTYQQIADGVGLRSISQICKYVDTLVAGDYLERVYSPKTMGRCYSKTVSLTLTPTGRDFLQMRLQAKTHCPACGQQIPKSTAPRKVAAA